MTDSWTYQCRFSNTCPRVVYCSNWTFCFQIETSPSGAIVAQQTISMKTPGFGESQQANHARLSIKYLIDQVRLASEQARSGREANLELEEAIKTEFDAVRASSCQCDSAFRRMRRPATHVSAGSCGCVCTLRTCIGPEPYQATCHTPVRMDRAKECPPIDHCGNTSWALTG